MDIKKMLKAQKELDKANMKKIQKIIFGIVFGF